MDFLTSKYLNINYDFAAAHCLHQKGRTEIRASEILLIFGAYNLEENSRRQFNTPSKVIIHNDWNPNDASRDADIALLIMEKEVSLSEYIKPICLWEYARDPRVDFGIAAGWEKANATTSQAKIPKHFKVPIHSQEDCLFSNSAFQILASKRTFCAGSRNANRTCTGKYRLRFTNCYSL